MSNKDKHNHSLNQLEYLCQFVRDMSRLKFSFRHFFLKKPHISGTIYYEATLWTATY